jgi:hypothetical protein
MALVFSGSSGTNRVRLLNNVAGATYAGLTIWMRFKQTSSTAAASSYLQLESNAANNIAIESGTGGTGCRLYSSTAAASTTLQTLTIGTWYDVFFNSSDTEASAARTIYVTEASAASMAAGQTHTTTDSWTIYYITIGANPNGTRPSNIDIDQLVIWDRSLSAAEMESARRKRFPVTFDSLWSWWPMIGGEVAEHLRDFVGGRTGVQVGSNTVVDGSGLPWGGSSLVPQFFTSLAPILSLPGVQDITATGARPKVTLTY